MLQGNYDSVNNDDYIKNNSHFCLQICILENLNTQLLSVSMANILILQTFQPLSYLTKKNDNKGPFNIFQKILFNIIEIQ